MTHPQNDALKACPHCGGEGHVSKMRGGGLRWWQVECVERECGAVGPAKSTEADAIAAWDTRDGRTEALSDLIAGDADLVCDEAGEVVAWRYVYADGEIVLQDTCEKNWDWLEGAIPTETPLVPQSALTAAQAENKRLREVMERCALIVERNNHRQNEKVDDVKHLIAAALNGGSHVG